MSEQTVRQGAPDELCEHGRWLDECGECLSDLESPRPELRSSAAAGIGHEGIVTVWDEHGRYVGCMGVELWRWLLTTEADRG